MRITNTQKDVPLIKYVLYKDNKKHSVSYSQIHDEYMNIKRDNTLNLQIEKDLKFYRQADVKNVTIKVFINNEFQKEVVL